MTKVRIALAGSTVGDYLARVWPPTTRTPRNAPRLHADVTLTRADDRLIRRSRRNPATGEDELGPPVRDPDSSGEFVVRVPEAIDRIETVRAALRLLDAVTDGQVRAAAALRAEIEPRYR